MCASFSFSSNHFHFVGLFCDFVGLFCEGGPQCREIPLFRETFYPPFKETLHLWFRETTQQFEEICHFVGLFCKRDQQYPETPQFRETFYPPFREMIPRLRECVHFVWPFCRSLLQNRLLFVWLFCEFRETLHLQFRETFHCACYFCKINCNDEERIGVFIHSLGRVVNNLGRLFNNLGRVFNYLGRLFIVLFLESFPPRIAQWKALCLFLLQK